MKPGDISPWPLLRLFKRLPFPNNYDRRLVYLRTRDAILKVLSWLSAVWGYSFNET